MIKECLQCGEEMLKPYNESVKSWTSRHKFCSKACKNESQKGIVPHDKGFKKGQETWNKGKKGEYSLPPFSDEHKEKLSLSKVGSLNPAWCGGKSTPQPYTKDWTMTLKRSIRERDDYTCKVCGKNQEDITFAVHHIDYNKENCNPDNLITLCSSCHSKTNHKRSFWSEFFNKRS